ncbi:MULTISPECIES: HEAT repeat domain-containing protein [unclassified Leptolyngbya]|uniref:HEAT repeat domain-containing protein n=1 Tax=unclassified Leptolyngbya TaxID=2650499 RepID=UPI0016834DC7|nr:MULTISPECIES: HEAT repeat domain-containing protein [unclassified Leptolyngbya]MBD1912749.1 HEAT repeat domain-containing protein [Leptolyngbya sp. FACHB-8]MBD2155737.1 HEAT repeat domain-containing protein [Leptolyngbya sp. FACHB-16]
MSPATYTDPVAKLLSLGNESPNLEDDWLDYPSQFGFTSGHAAELIRLTTDTQFDELQADRSELWAPIHAIRALGQLQIEEAIAPLMGLLIQDDDYIQINVPRALGMIGVGAIAPLTEFINDDQQEESARGFAIAALGAIGQEQPAARPAAIEALMALLADPTRYPGPLSTYIAGELIDLKATEAAPLIQQAFASGAIDEWIIGNWPQVQIDLGLKKESDFTPQELRLEPPPYLKEIGSMLKLLERQESPPQGFGTPKIGGSKKKKKKKK